jgi:NAD(P)H-hydrate epimerase
MKRLYTLPPLPPRPESGHKGLFGRVLVVGGNGQMFGAAVLAGTAALRAGSGLVQIAVPRDVLPHAIGITPELIGLALDNRNDKDLLGAAEAADVLVIGPGMGTSPASRRRLTKLIRLRKPAVLDADALNLLASTKSWPKGFSLDAVITPHPGEMKRLATQYLSLTKIPDDDESRIGVAASAATHFRTTVLFKGHRTIVTDGKQVYVNRTGDSTLSKAGAGDILSGLIGSLIGQGMTVYDAARAGAWLHGRAGEIAGESLGRRAALARDVIGELPAAFGQYR